MCDTVRAYVKPLKPLSFLLRLSLSPLHGKSGKTLIQTLRTWYLKPISSHIHILILMCCDFLIAEALSSYGSGWATTAVGGRTRGGTEEKENWRGIFSRENTLNFCLSVLEFAAISVRNSFDFGNCWVLLLFMRSWHTEIRKWCLFFFNLF